MTKTKMRTSTKSLTPADLSSAPAKPHTPPTKTTPPEGRKMADIRKPYGAEHLEEMHKGFCNTMHKCMKSMDNLDNDAVDNDDIKEHTGKIIEAHKAMAADTAAVHAEKFPKLAPLDHEESMKAMDGEGGEEGEEDEKSLNGDEAKDIKDQDKDLADIKGKEDEKAMSALDSSAGGSLVGDGKKKPSTVEGGEWRKKEDKEVEEDKEEMEEKALRKSLSELRDINDRNERRAVALGVM